MRLDIHISQVSGTQMAAKIEGTFCIIDGRDDDATADGCGTDSPMGRDANAAGMSTAGGCGCDNNHNNHNDNNDSSNNGTDGGCRDDHNDARHASGDHDDDTHSSAAAIGSASFPFEAIAFGRIGGQNIGAKLSDSVESDLRNAGYDADDVIMRLQKALLQGDLTLPEGLSREMFADDPADTTNP